MISFFLFFLALFFSGLTLALRDKSKKFLDDKWGILCILFLAIAGTVLGSFLDVLAYLWAVVHDPRFPD